MGLDLRHKAERNTTSSLLTAVLHMGLDLQTALCTGLDLETNSTQLGTV